MNYGTLIFFMALAFNLLFIVYALVSLHRRITRLIEIEALRDSRRGKENELIMEKIREIRLRNYQKNPDQVEVKEPKYPVKKIKKRKNINSSEVMKKAWETRRANDARRVDTIDVKII